MGGGWGGVIRSVTEPRVPSPNWFPEMAEMVEMVFPNVPHPPKPFGRPTTEGFIKITT